MILFVCNIFLLQLRRTPEPRAKNWATELLMLKVKVRELHFGGQFSTANDEVVLGKGQRVNCEMLVLVW